MVATCERISEAYLLPVLQDLMAQFPFEILGFHSDNGSEYINKTVASLLEKMRVEQTKSRSRHSNDNALAESKNGSVVRKALATAIFHSALPQSSMLSAASTSTPTSICTARVSLPGKWSMPRER